MSLKGSIFYLFLSAILGIGFAYTHSIIIIVASIILLIIIFKKFSYQNAIIFVVIFLFFNLYRINKEPIVKNDDFNNVVIVEETKPSYMIVYSKDNKCKYLVYLEEETFQIKDQLSIKGNIKKIENDLELDVFDFKEYLNHQRVFFELEPIEIDVVKTNQSLSNNIVNKLTSKLTDESYAMTKMLLFNDKYADVETYNALKNINALHLFVVSGFHISFFFNLIMKIFKKKKNIGYIIAFSIISIYVFLLDFSISATRALLTLILITFCNKIFNRLDCISLTGLLFLLIEPLNIFNYSFIMTYLMTITITFSSNALKDYHKIIQLLVNSLICFLAMMPIQLLLNYKINFISLLSNIILSYIVMGIFILCLFGLPLSLINGNLFGKIYEVFNNLVNKISQIDSSITFGSLNVYLLVAYYAIFILFIFYLEKKEISKIALNFTLIFFFFICLYNRNFFVFYQQVTFLNVYQGDCAIIQDSFNGKVMLIDTGGLTNYDIANKKIMPYLNYHGIRKIDVVVISHNDYDHCGALETLKKEIVIKQIINDPSIENIKMGKINLENLNKYYTNSSSENDHSLVLYGNICNYNFLFTGDISKTIEKQIITNNPYLDVDILKVAHHGSKSSSDSEFIEAISPTYAIISVGANNFYGHPTKEVLDILNKNDVIVYRTDINGTTRFKGEIFNKCFIDSAK